MEKFNKTEKVNEGGENVKRLLTQAIEDVRREYGLSSDLDQWVNLVIKRWAQLRGRLCAEKTRKTPEEKRLTSNARVKRFREKRKLNKKVEKKEENCD